MSQTDQSQDDQRNREPGSSLAKAPDLQQNYEKAQQATQPLEQPTPAPQRPPITAAQETDPIKALSIRSDQIKAANNTPQVDPSYLQDMQALAAQHRAGQPLGSEMVQSQAPAPKPQNSTAEGRASDAQAFDKKWATEQARAADYQEQMKDLAADLRDIQQDTDQQQGPGPVGVGSS